MCGIAGIFRGADTAGRKLRVERETEALIHRGPDDKGYFDDEIVTFGFRQLAVIDPESIVDGRDAPLGDPTTIPTWYMSRLARGQATVALSGEGADEVFGGYARQRYDVAVDRIGRVGRILLPLAMRCAGRAPSQRFLTRLRMAPGLLRQLDWLSPKKIREQGHLQPHMVSKNVDSHLRGDRDCGRKLWTLMVLSRWMETSGNR